MGSGERPATGIMLMLVAMLMFSLNDVLGKWLVSTYPVSQLMALRSLAALAVLLPILAIHGGARVIRLQHAPLQMARAALLAVEGMCFYAAVAALPLADTITFWLAAPIYVAILSPLLLGESVSRVVWGAILLGFAGVVIALGPSSQSLEPAAIIALAGSLAYALAMILSRKLRGTPDTVLVFWQVIGALLASAAGLLIFPGSWQSAGPVDTALLCLLGIVAMFAHVLVNRSFKHAPASTLMPYTYSLLIWAVVFGVLVFQDWPQPAMLMGAALSVAASWVVATRSAR